MKRWFAIFLLCLLVIAVGAAASLLWLREDRSQVAVTAETLEGDISAAEGFTAWQSAHMGRHLRWDLTIPLARPADTVAEYTYLEEELALSLRETAPLYFETGYLREENSPLEQVYKDVAARAPQLGPGETYTETVLLEGYLDAYPLYVYVYEQLAPAHGYSTFTVTAPAHKEIGRLMEDYFSFPLPPGLSCQVAVTDQGAVYSLDVPGQVRLVGDWQGDTYFFAFHGETNPLLSFEQVPGGYGIYRLDLKRQGEEVTGADIDTVYPLPEEAEVLALSVRENDLLVTLCQGDDYACLVLDTETLAEKQRLSVPALPPQRATGYFTGQHGESIPYPAAVWDVNFSLTGENFLLIGGDKAFHLYSVTDGIYTYEFSFRAPSRDLYADLGLELWDSYWNSCEVLWDGQRLAVAAITGPPFQTPTGLTLWIFRGGELLYQGSYTTSLNEETEQDPSHGESLEETLDKTVWILEGEGLSLGCDP